MLSSLQWSHFPYCTRVRVAKTLFAAVVMIWVYYLMRYLRHQSPVDVFVTGAALSASVYVRPIGYFLPVLVANALAEWALVGPLPKRRLLAHIGVFALTCL